MNIGDIYWVNFETAVGREYQKTRPALIVQNPEITKKSPYITVLPITSNLKNQQGPDVFIPKDLKNRLFSDSIIKVQQIATFDQSRIHNKIGVASSPVLRQVRGYLRRHFLL